jgi:D-lactate dehydrogenase
LTKGCEAVVLSTADFANEKMVNHLHAVGIKFIALRSVGYDHVALKQAHHFKMKVANVPSYSPYSIAEHTVLLLLAVNRKLSLGQFLMKQNDFRLDQLVGFDLHGKTIGVIGTGTIGAVFAKIMHGFGCQLVAYDMTENKELLAETNIKYGTLKEVCAQADVISVHCPLNVSSTFLFNASVFQQMKKGMIFINTARGKIVNTADLLEAMDAGIIAGAGLDVYENETHLYFENHSKDEVNDTLYTKLREHPKVLLTGHQAFLTNEALKGIADTTISNLTAWQETGRSENDLNE